MAVSTDLLCITMSPLAASRKAGQDIFDRFYSPRETFWKTFCGSQEVFSDSDLVHSYAKRLRRKSAILLAQIVLSFHNKGPSIRAIMTVISLLSVCYGNPKMKYCDAWVCAPLWGRVTRALKISIFPASHGMPVFQGVHVPLH